MMHQTEHIHRINYTQRRRKGQNDPQTREVA